MKNHHKIIIRTTRAVSEVIDVSMQLIKNYGKTVKLRIGPTFLSVRTALLTADYHLIEFILSGNKILKKSENYQFFRHWLGQGLVISDGRYLLLLFSVSAHEFGKNFR